MLFALFLKWLQNFGGVDVPPDKIDVPAYQNGIDVYLGLFTLVYADDTTVHAQTESDLQFAFDAVSIIVINKMVSSSQHSWNQSCCIFLC